MPYEVWNAEDSANALHLVRHDLRVDIECQLFVELFQHRGRSM
jgi:hypothetical protein